MNTIKFAVVRFATEVYKLKNFDVEVTDIFYNKNDEKHIQPLHDKDFQEGRLYYVYDRICGCNCKPQDDCCTYIKANIISLGGK